MLALCLIPDSNNYAQNNIICVHNYMYVGVCSQTNEYCRTGFNCENQIASFSRVCKLILLIAHPYVQFAQTQLLNSQCS